MLDTFKLLCYYSRMINTVISSLKPFIECSETDEYLKIVYSNYNGLGEKHHILPESIYPEYAQCEWNLINLTYENHYRVHELLPFMLEGQNKYKMLCAWNQMCGRTKGEFIDAKRYAELKIAFSENNPSKLDSVKQKKAEKWKQYWADPEIRAYRDSTNTNKGKKFPERGAKISAAKKGKPNGTKGIKKPKDFTEKYLRGGNNPMAKAVICDGIRFPTITEAGKHFGYTKQAVMYWLKKGRFYYEGEEPKEYIPIDSRTSGILVNGVKFDTMNSAAMHFDVTTVTLRNWIKSGKATKLPKES